MYIFTVETRDINMSIKNNPEKFPHGYVFEITDEEKNAKDFTEKGLYMLATILKSKRTTKANIAIIEPLALHLLAGNLLLSCCVEMASFND